MKLGFEKLVKILFLVLPKGTIVQVRDYSRYGPVNLQLQGSVSNPHQFSENTDQPPIKI